MSSVSAGRNNSKEVPSDGAVRFFVNLGAKDDLDWMTLKDFLRDTLDLGRDDLFKVDVKDGFSFFNTEAEHAEKVMEVLNGLEYKGRRVNVEISNNDGGRNGGRRDHNNRGRSGGGFRGGERRSEGGFRGGERRSSNRSSEGRGERRSSEGGYRGGERRSSSDRSSSDRAPRNERGSRRSGDGDSSRRSRRD